MSTSSSSSSPSSSTCFAVRRATRGTGSCSSMAVGRIAAFASSIFGRTASAAHFAFCQSRSAPAPPHACVLPWCVRCAIVSHLHPAPYRDTGLTRRSCTCEGYQRGRASASPPSRWPRARTVGVREGPRQPSSCESESPPAVPAEASSSGSPQGCSGGDHGCRRPRANRRRRSSASAC